MGPLLRRGLLSPVSVGWSEAFGKSRRPGSENLLYFYLFLSPEWGQTLPYAPRPRSSPLLLAGPTGLGALTDPRRKVILWGLPFWPPLQLRGGNTRISQVPPPVFSSIYPVVVFPRLCL